MTDAVYCGIHARARNLKNHIAYYVISHSNCKGFCNFGEQVNGRGVSGLLFWDWGDFVLLGRIPTLAGQGYQAEGAGFAGWMSSHLAVGSGSAAGAAAASTGAGCQPLPTAGAGGALSAGLGTGAVMRTVALPLFGRWRVSA
jgi:hypothetical protein